MSVTAARRPVGAARLLGRRFLAGYGLVGGFALGTLALLLAHGGGLLNFAYPALAGALALLLFAARRGVYVAFVLWIWLFTPLVRRLVDYQTGYHAVSPVMLAPLLVSLVGCLAVARAPRVLLRRRLLPYSLFALVLAYGLVVGAIGNGLLPALFDFANWGIPLGFGIFILADTRHRAEIEAAFGQAAVTGLLGISAYGLYQFYHFPAWDAYWLDQSGYGAAGPGLALQVRLFGPLNSPGPYGIALMALLVLALAARGKLKLAASAAGYPAFGLSLVRSAWGGWALAAVYLLARSGGRLRLRLLLGVFVAGLLAWPLLSAGPVVDVLARRFASLGNLPQDGSYLSRASLYAHFTGPALSQPVGLGLGYNGLATRLNATVTGGFDSGVLELPYEFGWAGGAVVLWALAALVLRLLGIGRAGAAPFELACAGVFFAVLAENAAGLTFSGVSGVLLWCAAAFADRPPP
jgi:hypothetical protein